MKIVRSSIIGLLIGLSSSYILMTLSILSVPGDFITGPELLKQVILAAILGIVIGLISLIFDSEQLSFTTQLVVHYILITICIFTAGYFGHWYDVSEISTITGILISEAVIYVLTWGILYVLIKRDIKEMNHSIQKKRGAKE